MGDEVPTRELGWDEGLVAYTVFYHRARQPDTTTARDVKVMNDITSTRTFRLISSPNAEVDLIGQ